MSEKRSNHAPVHDIQLGNLLTRQNWPRACRFSELFHFALSLKKSHNSGTSGPNDLIFCRNSFRLRTACKKLFNSLYEFHKTKQNIPSQIYETKSNLPKQFYQTNLTTKLIKPNLSNQTQTKPPKPDQTNQTKCTKPTCAMTWKQLLLWKHSTLRSVVSLAMFYCLIRFLWYSLSAD